MRHLTLAEALLKQHEGKRLHPYHCTADKLTIGYGRNLEDKGISDAEALYLLANDIAECEQDMATFSYWPALNDSQKAALIDMRYCLGAGGFRGFRNMHSALERGDYPAAAREVLDSKFARQVKGRAQDIADMLVLPE
ncbi:glycoside hydrolase family protein [Parahaliea mediterranea]|uniref:glycoside hydrolase family protein n=1 Tax=Parahaliea mediterranea TaxID=651086 RepID=UPI0019D45F65|nr:glycoside hydrolase family protein [Parahaliea mediterranea]